MTNLPGDCTYDTFSCTTIANINPGDERLQMTKDRLRTGIWRLGQTRMCHRSTGLSTEWLRYVPTRFFGMTGGVWFLGYKEEALSSTRLRRALAASNDGEQLSKSITDVALSPRLLTQYIKSHAAGATLQRKRPAEEDKGAEAKRVEREGQQRQLKRLKLDFARNEDAYRANQRIAWRGREKSDFRDWNRLEWQDRRDVYKAERAMTQNWKTLKDPIRKENILFQYLEKMLRERKKSADARAKVTAAKPDHV